MTRPQSAAESILVGIGGSNTAIDAAKLKAESHYAAMVCVGSVLIGRIARVLVGSTAAALAHKAHCPVAIIRTDHDAPASDTG